MKRQRGPRIIQQVLSFATFVVRKKDESMIEPLQEHNSGRGRTVLCSGCQRHRVWFLVARGSYRLFKPSCELLKWISNKILPMQSILRVLLPQRSNINRHG